MIIHVKSKYLDEQVRLQFDFYADGTSRISAFTLEGEPAFKATVVTESKPADGCVFLKGWSENVGIPEALVKAGVVELTGRTVPTGFCEAVEARLL